jgi:hypothetical protein
MTLRARINTAVSKHLRRCRESTGDAAAHPAACEPGRQSNPPVGRATINACDRCGAGTNGIYHCSVADCPCYPKQRYPFVLKDAPKIVTDATVLKRGS